MINKCRLFTLCLVLAAAPLFAAEIVIINNDDPGIGLNDPTPVDPIGGNTGTTLGEQRLKVLEHVAEIWGGLIESDVTIVVRAQTTTFDCSGDSTTLATAGTTFIFQNFPNTPIPGIWYHSALADAIAGDDQNPGEPDIQTQFNRALDDPECSNFGPWYYGLDQSPPGGETDLLATMLHEYAHGLGFANFVNESTGGQTSGRGDVYSAFLRDLETGKNWNDMTDVERRDSSINDPDLVWVGEKANAAAADLLLKALTVSSSATGTMSTAEAAFGGTVKNALTGDLVLADDGTGDSTSDACTALNNNVSGKIVLADRGVCEFGVKVLNAQNAGAIAVVIANNQEGADPFSMGGGEVGGQVTIPSAMVSLENGQTMKDGLGQGSVSFTFARDEDSDAAGTNAGFVRVNAPDPVAPGSSVSHWTTDATPNLLMEPNITSGLEGVDITTALFEDIGWTLPAVVAGTPRLIYPWLSFNSQFDTIFVLNNPTDQSASVTLTGRRASDPSFSATVSVPAGGLLASPIDQIFTDLVPGSGFSVVAESATDGIQGRWVTRGLQSGSGDSPSQGVAFELDGAGVGNALLFGYMPSSDDVISAPVIVNTGTTAADVTLYFFNENGNLIATDNTSVAGLESYRPFAAPVTNLVVADGNVTMVAHSPSQKIAGAVFVFNLSFLEPAIGSAQVIDFTPP